MQRKSKKREAVYSQLRKSHSHPTAESLYEAVKQHVPNISLSTVYRNLAEFCSEGQAKCVARVNGQAHYDAAMHTHDHFVCEECGSVIDIEPGEIRDSLINGLEKSNGMKATTIALYGICASCLSKK